MNTKKTKLFSLILCIVMTVGLFGCSSSGSSGSNTQPSDSSAPADNTVYELKICHIASDSDPINEGWLKFKSILEEKSNNRIKVSVFGNKSIANSDTESAEKVQQNIVQMTSVPSYAAAALGNIAPFKVFDYPYLFESNDEIYTYLDSDLFQSYCDQLEAATGVRAMKGYSIGWLDIMSTKTPINTIDDLSGLKIRTMSTDVQMAFINALGANATPVNYGELYTACQQGTVDGLMTSVGLMVSDRFYEVNKYMICSEAMANVHIPLVNVDWYDSLPDDLKDVFDECFEEYLQFERQIQADFCDKALDTMRSNNTTVVEMTDSLHQEFKARTETVYTDYPDAAGEGTVDAVLELLGK